ncbi:hypothetical protein [Porphyrobacter sp. CACIAM 03H1]|uniref:hypothetical protein n=1 Tax=Porphyrobacter sp. CACIAM 03H1 TaxID=2003315 RepID=UPI000B5A48A4|nr:hypothetical protein [Porphyrobacter sp. CACIAM 03H1]ASJ91983.1 hypothetical protein CBR61_14295 [Porphyrobacter sp. CACIAM 03H1]
MELHLVDPAHQAPELPQPDTAPGTSSPKRTWRQRASDLCFIALKASGFIASSYLMALGVPLLFFLALSGGDAGLLFAQLANIAERFLAADHARQVAFLGEVKVVLIGLATVLIAWRLPRFLRDLNNELSGEKS